MAFFALGLGLLAWPLLSHTLPDSRLSPQITLGDPSTSQLHMDGGGVIDPSVASFIQETIALENITGLSVTVIPKHGEPEFRTWGYRTEEGDVMTPDTLFYIGSLSKAFCVSAMGLLIDDFANGRNVTALPSSLTELTWRTRMKDLLPDWQLMDKLASERANLHDILSHVSGIPRHEVSYSATDTPLDVLKKLSYLDPAFELRERFSYSNIMFMVAAHVIETYTGQPYTSFVEERVFSPLDMTSSTFSLEKAEVSGKFSQGWTKRGRRLPAWLTEDMGSLIAGPGGVISNAIDMSKWISMWIGGGTHRNQTIIPLSVYQNATYAYTVGIDHPLNPDFSIVGYGMGWSRLSYRGHDVVTHMGGLFGYSTALAFLPSDGLGVSVFANGDEQAVPVQTVLYQIVDAALGLPTSRLSGPSRSNSKPPESKLKPGYINIPKASNAHIIASCLDALAGTYTNPGYGTLTLCGPSGSDDSSYCARVGSDFAAVDYGDGQVNDDNDGALDLLAAWPQFFASHVRMRYRLPSDDDVRPSANANSSFSFDVYFTYLFPDGYGKDRTSFELADIGVPYGTAEFVLAGDGHVAGFQMWDGELLSGVWFERVLDS